VSNEGLVTLINAPFLASLGYTAEEVVNRKKFTDLLTVGSKIFFQTHFFPLIKLHGKFNELFLSFITRSGEELPVLLNAVMTGNDEVFEIHCGGLQIAQRNRFEKELLEAKKVAEKALLENEALVTLKAELEHHQELLERRLQKLTQSTADQKQINVLLSHDLQEPLRKIALFSGRLLTDAALIRDTVSWKQVRKINKATETMREIVINIQQYLSLDETRIATSCFPLETAFNQALKRAHTGPDDPLVHVLTTSLPEVKADYELMCLMFHHLIGNSLKFKDPDKTRLEISLSTDVVEQNIFVELEDKYKYKEFLRITYSDNGIGFDNALATEMFALFRKAHDVKEGLGIGLSYCKKIAELHNGFISARSDNGKGANFVILLPL
jgi:sigma-B regulation protein RsbU (phosphoserine phosphatase)